MYLVSGSGCRVTDADGVERIDFISNYTSLAHGHCHPPVVEAVKAQAGRMASGAGPSELEIELGERLKARLPSIELLRFTNSGTEATMLAVRAARAFTGRSTVVAFAGAYHGTHDLGVSIPADSADRPHGRGVPAAVAETLVVAPYNDIESTSAALDSCLDDLAAVIVEPVLGAGGVIPAEPTFLAFLRERTREAGALLLFDEVISFRIGYHGAQGRYGVKPDLTTLGKIIGGGLPIGAVGGRGEVMELFDPRSPDRMPHGGTFNGNPLSAAAGLATLDGLPPAEYERLESLAMELRQRLEGVFDRFGVSGCVTQIGSLFNVHFADGPIHTHADVLAGDLALLRELHLAMLGHGILTTPRGMGCLSTPMGEAEIDAFLEAAELSLRDLGFDV